MQIRCQKSDLQIGDVILSVNEIPVNRPSEIRKIISENDLRPSDILNLKIFRDGKYKNLKLILGKSR